MNEHRVLVVNPILYHYRRGVFRELDRRAGFRFTFMADIGGRDGIIGMDPIELSRHVRLRVRRFGRLEWHSGLIGHLVRHRYDSVVFLGDVTIISTWLAALFARAQGARVYFWTIGWHRPETGLKRTLRLWFYRIANVLLVYGEIGREIGIALGYPEARIKVIGNSVEAPDHGFELGDVSLIQQGVVCLGAVIRLTPVKRLDLLIDAAAVLRSEGVDVRLLLVGDGPMATQLANQAVQLAVPLELPGGVYGASALARVYDCLDVTVVPAAVGLTAVQSLGFGVPVVSDNDRYSQMPEWESIVDGVTGALYHRGDVRGLAQAIRSVLDLRDRLGPALEDACRAEVAQRWSPASHADRIIGALGECGEVDQL